MILWRQTKAVKPKSSLGVEHLAVFRFQGLVTWEFVGTICSPGFSTLVIVMVIKSILAALSSRKHDVRLQPLSTAIVL